MTQKFFSDPIFYVPLVFLTQPVATTPFNITICYQHADYFYKEDASMIVKLSSNGRCWANPVNLCFRLSQPLEVVAWKENASTCVSQSTTDTYIIYFVNSN